MDVILKYYDHKQIKFVNCEILDMNPDSFIRRGYKGALKLKKLINSYEVDLHI